MRWRSLAGGLMVAWRHDESLPICRAGARARSGVSAHARQRSGRSPCSAATSPTSAAARRASPSFRQALQLAEEIGDHLGLERAYVNLTDALTMLGRPRESARLAQAGLEAMRRYGIDSALLVANQIEALLAIGDWDEADSAQRRRAPRASPRASRTGSSSSAPTSRSAAATSTPRERTSRPRAPTLREDRVLGLYDGYLAELALWERRWTDADAAIHEGLAQARHREAAQIRVQLCAKGLRAQAELAALARARRDADALRDRLGRARKLLAVARRAAAEASAVTPNAAGWLALAEAEYERARGEPRPEAWSEAAATWERLERPPLAAYCRWRQAEALVAAGALPRRGERAAPGGARRRGSDRSKAAAAGARAARRTRAARSRAARRAIAGREAGPRRRSSA